jgi:hypothetical protein
VAGGGFSPVLQELRLNPLFSGSWTDFYYSVTASPDRVFAFLGAAFENQGAVFENPWEQLQFPDQVSEFPCQPFAFPDQLFRIPD